MLNPGYALNLTTILPSKTATACPSALTLRNERSECLEARGRARPMVRQQGLMVRDARPSASLLTKRSGGDLAAAGAAICDAPGGVDNAPSRPDSLRGKQTDGGV